MTEDLVPRQELEKELRELRQRIRDFEVLKAEIRQSEEKQRIRDKILEISLNGIAVADLTGNITYVNRAILDMFGFFDEQEVLGKHFTEFARNPEEALAIKYELLMKENYVGETEGKRKDGSSFVLEFYASVVKDGKGRPLCFTFSCMDVTERRQAEESLRESEERYRTLVESSPDGICVVVEGRVAFLNTVGAKLLGADDPQQIIGMAAIDFLHPDFHDAVRQRIQQVVEDRKRFDPMEAKFVRLGGAAADLEISDSPIMYRNKPAIQIIFRDITARKEAEKALTASHKRLTSVLDSLDAFVYVADLQTFEVLYANLQLKNTFGDVEGKICWQVFRDGQTERCVSCTEDRLFNEDGEPAAIQTSELLNAATDRWYSVNDRAIRWVDGRLVKLTIATDITERKKMEEAIRYQAYHDLLTGLPNRLLFMDRLELSIAQVHRNRTMLAVMFLDLDYFKNVNDTLGHTIGDQLLKAAALRLRDCIRESDTIARIGGDEFNVLLPDIAQAEDAAKIAKKIVSIFEEPYPFEGRELRITTSIGISLYPDDGRSADSLLKNADIAMYHAKEKGRNNYQFYNAAMNVRDTERMILESSLRKMIERRELVLYYQPRLDMNTRQMVGAEALVRWQHPELGLLTPNQFIPLAEETGLISSIDEWVLHTACTRSKAWQDSGYQPIRIGVNLSAKQFQQPDLAETVSRVLQITGLRPEHLELDIAESTAMQNIEVAVVNLGRLAGMGVRVSIDDFGAGQSSLSQLVKLPIHNLKIDNSFIRSITSDPDYRAVINSLITLAHNLKLGVVAEGVENNEQLSFLRSSKCDEMQGFLFCKPLPEEKFQKLIMFRK